MHQAYLQAIKSFEGFTPQAKWDYAQHSNGYGTKALYPGEAIDAAEAERRFAAEIAVARGIVEKHAAGWDEGTKAALTSLTFNAGTRWISSGLGDAVRNGDIEGVRERFVQYAKAGGEVLPGLLKRRLAELDWIGGGVGGTPGAATAAVTADAARPMATGDGAPVLDAVKTAIIPGYKPEFAGASNLRDALDALRTSDVPDMRRPQALSLLITALFDLQMRTTQAAPGDRGEADQST